METVIKMAWNPDTNQEYEIELPDNNVVEKVLLEIDFPPDGFHRDKITDILAERFSLTDKQRNAKYKSGPRVFNVLVGHVASSLVKSGQAVAPKRMWININPEQTSRQAKKIENNFDNDGSTPEKSIEENYQQIGKELAVELLQKISENTPDFFEKLVVDLLVAMGYGGSREDAGKAVGRGGDGGIDGIINEDRLGLDVVYIQAKQWKENVSRPEIQKFAGALQGQRARKGVFITTSGFTKGAEEYVKTIDSKIILIDGNQVAQYMIDHNVGVSTTKTYEIKRVDSDYFAQDTENS